ncbi:MAG: RNA polymerase sigma factor [bacterium]
MTETRALIASIKAGNTAAYQSFIEKYKRLVIHIVFRMVSNATDREDLCQDVFVKVYQHLNAFRYQAKVSTWIAKIAYNTCINHLQKKKIPLFDDRTPETESLENVTGNHALPDLFVEDQDVASRLQGEINRLDIRYRTILTLYHLEEMSYAEIGKIMDMPEGTVKSHLFRARKQLKEKLLSKYRIEELWNAST